MNNAAPIINTPNNETINPNQPLSENNIINSNYISLLTKKIIQMIMKIKI